MMKLSKFGQKFSSGSGIQQLMDDLGNALSGGAEMLMLGGGNPSHIPAVQDKFRQRMRDLMAEPNKFEETIGNYDTPQGKKEFIEALADLLRREFNWDISSKNIALTNGSQNSFFLLFNMFAGETSTGKKRKILLPLTPEYIGYADVGLVDNFFESHKPKIEILDEHLFKYHVNFDDIEITDEIGAICVSRPTNPTGNVLTDAEITQLGEMAKENDIPLIVDNAYGTPFPHIIYTDAKPSWDEHIILTMSLSKLGLPATRTGIVIAREEVIKAICDMNAILCLAPSGVGVALAQEMVSTGEIIELSNNIIKNYYYDKSRKALEQLRSELSGFNAYVHKAEGALFLWLWMKGLPITSEELYERLKARGVLVVSGHYFFPGLKDDWRHREECIRITYAQNDDIVSRGLAIIADEVKKAYRAGA